MRIYIVATYEAMVNPIKKLMKKYGNIDIDYGVGMLDDGLKLATEAKKRGYEAIISRGGTARLIRKHLDIPIIDAKPSGNDLLKSILIAKNNDLKTSVIAYSNITDGALEIIELLNLNFKVHYINDKVGLSSLLIDLKNEGYQQILGDSLAIKLSKDLNFNTVLFQTSYETLENFLGYAIMILKQTKKINEMDVIRSRFLTNAISNYCIILNNKIIFSKLENFEKIPVSYEKCINLIYEFEEIRNHKSEIKTKIDDVNIRVTSINISNDKYYLCEFKKIEKEDNLPIGVYEFEIGNNFIPVEKSKAMKNLYLKLQKLVEKNEAIFIEKDNEYTLNEVLNYILSLNKSETILIDGDKIEIENYFESIKNDTKNIILKNIKSYEVIEGISNKNKNYDGILIIVLDKNSNLLESVDPSETIMIPGTIKRKDDLINIFNNYITNYREKHGTAALKIQDDMFENDENLLEEDLDDLLMVLRRCILEEDELLITKEIYLEHLYKIKNEDTKPCRDISLDQMEKEAILYQLQKENYNQSRVSEILGISRSTLWRKMKKYNI